VSEARQGGEEGQEGLPGNVRVYEADLADFAPDEANANQGTERGRSMLERSLHETGMGRSLVVDREGRIAAGNKTQEAAVDRGFTRAIVVESDGDVAVVHKRRDFDLADPDPNNPARRYAYWDNRTSEVDLRWNPERLKLDWEEGFDFSRLFTEEEFAKELARLESEASDPGPLLDIAEILQEKWQVQPGQVWLIPSVSRPTFTHRVMCGDSTRAEDVERLLGGARPAITVTDPPYGVEYDPEWRVERGLKGDSLRMDKVENDDRADWTPAFALSPSDVVYCWHGGVRTAETQHMLEAAGYVIRNEIIWVKTRAVISRGHYHWQHEPCWYAVRKGATAHWIGDRRQTTVWIIPGDRTAPGGHSTQKPVECMARPLQNHAGDVYEPFLGSGTTLVAAETKGRVGYGMEIVPRCVAATLERLLRMGLAPVAEER